MSGPDAMISPSMLAALQAGLALVQRSETLAEAADALELLASATMETVLTGPVTT